MIFALILIPTVAGVLAFIIRSDYLRRTLLVFTAIVHAALTAITWLHTPIPIFNGWLRLDPVGLLFLSITSLLFLIASIYAVGYLQREGQGARPDFEEETFFTNSPSSIFTGCLLLFLATMTLVTVSHHFGLLWVAVEATTLASAPLIYFHRHHRSLEATWKYLLICSVGVALALLGNFFLTVAATTHHGPDSTMVLDELIKHAQHFDPHWLKAAFLLLLVGYGTKMGLAPLHTWLPDAHSEAPSVISALLSGALLNCAFIGILRAQQVCIAAGQAAFGQELLIGFGLFSMAIAGIFILGQADYKRMLAYSSVEHMGILALGIGLGGAASFGTMFHAVNHSLSKMMLFLVGGNILTVYQTKRAADVRGVLRVLPISGALWLIGFFAITGSPPFAPFLSELIIFKATLDGGHIVTAIFYAAFLALIFIGMTSIFLNMAQGLPSKIPSAVDTRETPLAIAPPIVLAVLVFCLGLYVPPVVNEVLHQAAALLGGF